MTPFEHARKIFSNFPEEIFSTWIDEVIKKNGWPPNGADWNRALLGYPFLYWQKLQWSIREIDITFEKLGPLSRKAVNSIMEANVMGKPNPYAEAIKDTKARFDAIFKYVLSNQMIPGTPVFFEEGGFYEILEGEHRISVMCAMRQFSEFKKYVPEKVPAWIGSLDPAFNKLFGR
jgi:hypothetical protein